MMGGSERIVTEMAREMARLGHSVTVRLPYELPPSVGYDCVRDSPNLDWISASSPSEDYDVLFCADDFARSDRGARSVLVASRSDPPPHTDFDEMVFLSRTHARLMGHRFRPVVGGGVDPAEYAHPLARVPRRVICTSSPDRCPKASAIGAGFDFVHTYRPVGGVGNEFTREEVVMLQRSAMVHIYPLDPVRPSDFFSMSVLESLAAGTPVIVSDADAMDELWADAALVVHRPIDLGEWAEATERFLTDRALWQRYSAAGRKKAKEYSWPKQASRLLNIALA
jgi:glycosyltransferase involved in cell wall biosynthesis